MCIRDRYITGSYLGMLHVWDIINTKHLKKIQISKHKTEAVDLIEFIGNPYFGAGGLSLVHAQKIKYFLAVAMSDQTIKIVDWVTGEIKKDFQAGIEIRSLARIQSLDKKLEDLLACGGVGPNINLWSFYDKDKKSSAAKINITSNFSAISTLHFFLTQGFAAGGHKLKPSRLLAVGELPQGNQLTVKVEVWSVDLKKCLTIFDTGHPHRINSIAYQYSKVHGNLLVTAGSSPDDNYLKIWNVEFGYMMSLELISSSVIKCGLLTHHIREPENQVDVDKYQFCLLYTSPSPRDRQKSRMPSSA
eukprot:TRINITY_DN460_c0_g1_i14.p1 TRINITY_DN460_c0_g1~~TRINITY_DN460_c0_g1_i14.p1  ORF type:complete len:303 (-),score=44.98 TRINITY_DN460_c0_g1_i14:61-969(-)